MKIFAELLQLYNADVSKRIAPGRVAQHQTLFVIGKRLDLNREPLPIERKEPQIEGRRDQRVKVSRNPNVPIGMNLD